MCLNKVMGVNERKCSMLERYLLMVWQFTGIPDIATSLSLFRTTQFCVVVPIEDSEYTPSSTAPVKSPIRIDMTKNYQKRDEEKDCVMVNEMSIPLPGTPTNDHDNEENSGSASHVSAKSRETIGQLVLNMDDEQSQESVTPDSPRSSESFSSRGSTKSTDVLLPKEK